VALGADHARTGGGVDHGMHAGSQREVPQHGGCAAMLPQQADGLGAETRQGVGGGAELGHQHRGSRTVAPSRRQRSAPAAPQASGTTSYQSPPTACPSAGGRRPTISRPGEVAGAAVSRPRSSATVMVWVPFPAPTGPRYHSRARIDPGHQERQRLVQISACLDAPMLRVDPAGGHVSEF
jgi:hypothetical protein